MNAIPTTAYPVEIIRILDGDTVEVSASVWPGVHVDVKVRLDGINAPEIHTRRACEKMAGLKAKAAMKQILSHGPVTLANVHLGKYAGRVLGKLTVNGHDAGQILIEQGLARPYSGGRRQPWCD